MPADQPVLLAPPVASLYTLSLASCSLPPSSSPLPRFTPSSAVLHPFLPPLVKQPCPSPTRPPVWPPLPSPAAVSPINLSVLASELRQHPSSAFRDYLLTGFKQGFTLGFQPSRVAGLQATSTKIKSAILNHDVVEQYLAREVSLRRGAGPFTSSPFASPLHTNRFGIIPKRGRPGKWRLIVDLSFPQGASVNDGIDSADFPLSYSRVDDAIDFIMLEGHGTLLAKVDIRDAYRLIPIHPHDRYLLGMSWDNQLYVDLALPFGLRSAPFIFNQLAEAWHWMLRYRHGIRYLLHYLDDYLTAGAPNSGECHNNLSSVRSSASSLGIPLALDKVVGPSTVLSFLGIELDTRLFVARLPTEKVFSSPGLKNVSVALRSWSPSLATSTMPRKWYTLAAPFSAT